MENAEYVHGYSEREALRLNDQASTLEEIIHNDTIFTPGSLVLEAGCGVGAQTGIIAPRNPGCQFISIDISEESIKEAGKNAKALNISNVEFRQADIFSLPFEDDKFDGIVICFVLEHLSSPANAVNELMRVLRPGGKIIIIEGDHGSTFFYPDSIPARKAVNCQIVLQKESGGNANIGRELYPLMLSAGIRNISVSPRMVYVDSSRPSLVDGFIKNTFTAMIEGIKDTAVKKGLSEKADFEKGIRDLYRTAEPDGVFCYTFFKGAGVK
jgi:threonine dehydrogenase-like Zn-dependent dehydrogenase